jgi:hypothetical protein
VVSKYADHVPLYRQSAILERETGIELSRATLDGWVMRVGELLQPITAAMGQELLNGTYLQADETTVGGWTTSSRHYFDCGNLSTPQPTSSRLSRLCASRFGRLSHQSSR